MEDEFITTNQAKEMLHVSVQSIYRWCKSGKLRYITAPSGRKRFNLKDVQRVSNGSPITSEKRSVCYCRVSSSKQVDDLRRQEDCFRSKYPTHDIVSDIGSGLNWKRKGLTKILEQAMQGHINEVVVAHRDRLCRFAYELLEFIFLTNKVKLVVLNEEEGAGVSSEQELANDILSIVHVYSCRNMGRRRYKNKKDTALPDAETEEDSKEMDGHT